MSTPDETLRRYISNPAVRAKVEAAVGEKVAQAIEAKSASSDIAEHRCFKPWCPQCHARKTFEQTRERFAAVAREVTGGGA